MIHRIDLINSPVTHGASQQLLWTGLGIVLAIAVIVLIRDHRPLQRFTYTLGLAGLLLLLLPLIPGLGVEIGGARIWIHAFGLSFQPAEVAKVVLAIAFASYMVEKRDVLALAGFRILGIDLPRARDLGPILMVWLTSLAILVFQNDLGTSLLFFGLFVMMLYVATERPGWAVLGTLLFAGGGVFAYLNANHVRIRVGAWLHPFTNYDAYGQIISAQFGLAWGGLLGRGLGEGRPGLTPLARSDFIAAAIGEELGIAGLFAVIMVYALDRRTRPADGTGLPGAVRQALVGRTLVRLRPAGVRDHRRGDPAAAADRPDHPVHVPGRLVHDRQLGGDRAAAADQPPGAQAGGHHGRRPAGRAGGRDHPTDREDGMNKPIRRVAFVAMLMFALLFANGTYLTVVRQSSLNANPYNRRVRDAEFAQNRGAILVGSTAVARTTSADDRFKYQRTYSDGPLYAPITGYFSYNHGSSNLESSYNSELAGTDDSLFVRRLIDTVTNKAPRGASVQTTINAAAQKAAAKALGNQKGAVVALNPKTGAVLAMVTSPSYDPNKIATHDVSDSNAAYNTYLKDRGQADVEPGGPRDLPPGLDVQTGHRRRRPGQRPHPGKPISPRRTSCCCPAPAPIWATTRTAAETRSP